MNSISTNLPVMTETARGPGAKMQTGEPEAFAGVLQTAQQEDASNGPNARPAPTRSGGQAQGGNHPDEGAQDTGTGIRPQSAGDSAARPAAQPAAEASPGTSENSQPDATETSGPTSAAGTPIVTEMAVLQALLQCLPPAQSPTPTLPAGQGSGGETTLGLPASPAMAAGISAQAGAAGLPGGLPAALNGQPTDTPPAAGVGLEAVALSSARASGMEGASQLYQTTVAGAQTAANTGEVSATGATPQATGQDESVLQGGPTGGPGGLATQAAAPANGSAPQVGAQATVPPGAAGTEPSGAQAGLSPDPLPISAAVPAKEGSARQVGNTALNEEAQPSVSGTAGPVAASLGSQPGAETVSTVAAGPALPPGDPEQTPVGGVVRTPEAAIPIAGGAIKADPAANAVIQTAGSAPNESPAQGRGDQNKAPSTGGIVETLQSALDGRIEAGSSPATGPEARDGHGKALSPSQPGATSTVGATGSSQPFVVAASASSQGPLAGQTVSGGEAAGTQSGTVTAKGAAGAAAAGAAATAAVDSGIPSAVGQAIMARLVQAVRRGERQFHLELHPAELGRVQAQLSINAGKLSLFLDVETVQAQHAVQNSLPELRQGLEARGLVLDQCQVGFGGGQTHGGGHYESHGRQAPAIPISRLDGVPVTDKVIDTNHRVRAGRSVDLMV